MSTGALLYGLLSQFGIGDRGGFLSGTRVEHTHRPRRQPTSRLPTILAGAWEQLVEQARRRVDLSQSEDVMKRRWGLGSRGWSKRPGACAMLRAATAGTWAGTTHNWEL